MIEFSIGTNTCLRFVKQGELAHTIITESRKPVATMISIFRSDADTNLAHLMFSRSITLYEDGNIDTG
ncbi:hypothetical protein C5614_30755 [Massilia phosphatilytica]|nr:hypothetical protein C5614_30755 [Massilia phosphatilytica]